MARDLAARGQRAATFLIYLNDGYEGGATQFPRLDWQYRGGRGDALLFSNTDAAGPGTEMPYSGSKYQDTPNLPAVAYSLNTCIPEFHCHHP